ncbi:MAG: VCBS repeat-containing protein, partial [Planctomycetota bacterium]
MKSMITRVLVVVFFVLVTFVSAGGEERRFVSSSRLAIGRQDGLTASVRVVDVNADGKLDVVVANGRHWPGP